MGIDDIDRRFTKPKPRLVERDPPKVGDLCANPRCGGEITALHLSGVLICGRCGAMPGQPIRKDEARHA